MSAYISSVFLWVGELERKEGVKGTKISHVCMLESFSELLPMRARSLAM